MDDFVWLRQPWAHQREVWRLATAHRDFALWLEMGTGKTFIAINVLRMRYIADQRLMRTLIICPPVVFSGWRNEFKVASKLSPDVHVLTGAVSKRTEQLRKHGFRNGVPVGRIFVTNYEALLNAKFFEELTEWGPEIIVFDESQRIKNPTTKRTKAAIKLADRARHRYCLSGSPFLNKGSLDVWAQFRALDCGETFDRNFYAFRARYFVDENARMPKTTYFPKWMPRAEMQAEFGQKLASKAVRVAKSECLDLPPLVRTTLDIELGAEQARHYREMFANFITFVGDNASTARLVLTQALRLQQILSGFVKLEDGTLHRFKDNPRLTALDDLVEDLVDNHKIIIWAIFREDIFAIQERLAARDVEHVSLLGGISDKTRQDAIDRFQNDPKCRVMVANQAAGGVGVTLTAASYSVYYSRGTSIEQDMQSEARNYRGGSEIHDKVTRIDLVAPGTMDENVLLALRGKIDVAEALIKYAREIKGVRK